MRVCFFLIIVLVAFFSPLHAHVQSKHFHGFSAVVQQPLNVACSLADGKNNRSLPVLSLIEAEDNDFNDSDDELKVLDRCISSSDFDYHFFQHGLFLKNLLSQEARQSASPSFLLLISALKL